MSECAREHVCVCVCAHARASMRMYSAASVCIRACAYAYVCVRARMQGRMSANSVLACGEQANTGAYEGVTANWAETGSAGDRQTLGAEGDSQSLSLHGATVQWAGEGEGVSIR